ncbi:MAG: 4-hydroxy-tetrahydrodipicolinate reductase [Polyangiaceae bacterium]
MSNTPAPLPIAVIGASGRMGLAIIRLAAQARARFTLVGAAEHHGSPALGKDAGELAGVGSLGVEVSADLSSAFLGAKCAIDFSTPSAVPQIAKLSARAKVALVTGTTGLDADAHAALDAAAHEIPVLSSPNMSVGVYVLADLVRRATRALADFDVEIVEVHHRLKADAPSGTALRLYDAVREGQRPHEHAAPIPEGARVVTGREGKPGPRTDAEIGVLAVRGGDVIGDHTVHLLGPGERIELTHRATNRDLFARGALRSAEAIAFRAPGRYGMQHVVEDPS